MPDVIGKSESSARKALEGTAGNFKVKDATVKQDSSEKEGTVLAVSPDPNGQYPSGQEFTLTVSTGEVQVEVPDVVTQVQDDAASTLKQLGFRVGFANGADPNAADQTVIQQSVKAGTKAAKGTLITLTINNLPQNTPPPSEPSTPEPTNTPPITPPIIGG